MMPRWFNGWFFIPVAVLFVIGLWWRSTLPYGDEIIYFNGFREGALSDVFQWITHLGEHWGYFIVLAALGLVRQRRVFILTAIVGVAALLMSAFAKSWFDAPRPVTWFDEMGRKAELVLAPGVEVNYGYTTFPSGHTMAAFALACILSLWSAERGRPVWGLVWATLAVMVGISRIFLVQHFLPDVLTGAAIGMSIAIIVWELASRRWK
ncbi:MAG: phosphatase PAP2 family protein [Saprospiraceae bacterium]|nr:phosphatase PAP2 family protein [Saprospiraceae bacterium]